jgi:4-amino-4-deoxy-L-arabinose transferase-like glycosyltransferase
MIFLVATSSILALLSFAKVYPDSYAYREYSLFILGKASTVNELVAMRPMLPLIASIVTLGLGNLDFSYGVVNSVFWVLGTLVSYKLALSVLKDQEAATLAALMYATSPAMLWFGAAVLVDSPAYFFTGFSILVALRQVEATEPSWRRPLNEIVVAIGLLFKETVILGILFLLIMRAYRRKGLKTILASTFLVVLLDIGILMYLSLDPQIIIRKFFVAQQQTGAYQSSTWGIIPLAKNYVNAYVPYFPSVVRYCLYPTLAFAGILSSKPRDRKILLACLAILSINALVWPVMTNRYSFAAWPAVILLLAAGMRNLLEKCCFLLNLPRSICNALGYLIIVLGAVLTIQRIAVGYYSSG